MSRMSNGNLIVGMDKSDIKAGLTSQDNLLVESGLCILPDGSSLYNEPCDGHFQVNYPDGFTASMVVYAVSEIHNNDNQLGYRGLRVYPWNRAQVQEVYYGTDPNDLTQLSDMTQVTEV